MADFFESIVMQQRLWLSLHLLGVCVGLGGASITDMLFFKFLKDFRISRKEAGIMHTLSLAIVGALLVIFISGFALYLLDPAKFSGSPTFTTKMIIVMILTLNGMLLHLYVSPKLVHLSFSSKQSLPPKYRSLRHLAFGLGAVSATSWYFTFFLAMLKSVIPENVSALHLLGLYGIIVISAILVSQCMEYGFQRSVSRKQRGK